MPPEKYDYINYSANLKNIFGEWTIAQVHKNLKKCHYHIGSTAKQSRDSSVGMEGWIIKWPNVHQFSSWTMFWLVVSTNLKNISQNGNVLQVGVKIKYIWNHHLVLPFSVVILDDLSSAVFPVCFVCFCRWQNTWRGKVAGKRSSCHIFFWYIDAYSWNWWIFH